MTVYLPVAYHSNHSGPDGNVHRISRARDSPCVPSVCVCMHECMCVCIYACRVIVCILFVYRSISVPTGIGPISDSSSFIALFEIDGDGEIGQHRRG